MNLHNFKKYAGPVITRRAADLYARDMVSFLFERNGESVYMVQGSLDYTVTIKTDGDEILRTSCDCPYGGMCVHVTAALMDLKQRREEDGIEEEPAKAAPGAEVKPKNSLGLSEDETFVLCFLAYSGQESYSRTLARLPIGLTPSGGLTQKDFEAAKKTLRRDGWLCTDQYFGVIKAEKIMDVLQELVRDRRPWLDWFGTQFSRQDYIRYLTEVAEVLCGESAPAVRPFKSGHSYYTAPDDYIKLALLRVLDEATPEQMGKFLNDSLICDLARILIAHTLEYDAVGDLETVGTMFSLLKHPGASGAAMYSRYRMAVFYARGEELPERPSCANYPDTYFLNAAKALLGGDAAGAIKLYQQGLKIQNKDSSAKNIPYDNVSFFLYVTALSIRRNEKDVSALCTIVKKRFDRAALGHLFVFPLAEFSSSSDQTKEGSFIESARGRYYDGSPAALNVIAALTACFFGMKDRWTQAFPQPKLLILRKECEHWFGEALSSEATAPWPYEPVLPRIPVRPVWELQLEEILHQVHRCAPEKAEAKDDRRLCYVASSFFSRYIEVREQGRLLSGAWSKGKTVSLLKYKTGDCPMDGIDKKIYAEWLKGDPAYDRLYAQHNLPSLELVLPHLVGTDKLVTEGRGSLKPIDVRMEKPFLWTEKTGGEIRFGTNIPTDAKEYSSMFAYFPNPGKVVIYPMEADVIPAYLRILKMGKLPEEAEPVLGRLFEALGGRLEVHSDISGGVSLPKVDGSALVTVRITPERDMFHLVALVRPLEGGSAEFSPASGDPAIYDTAGGVRMEVARDLKRERANLKKVNALMPAGCELQSGCTMDAADLLEFMDAVAGMPSVAALEWPEGEALRLYSPQTSKWEINAVGKGGWYELEGKLEVSEDRVMSVGELLSLLRSSDGRYVRLGEKEYLQLSDNIRRQLERLGYASQEYRGKVRVPELALAAIGDQLAGEIALEEPDAVLELRERIRRSRNVTYDVPESLNATLRYYQAEGYQWLMRLASWGAGACLADDMGLGKTVQAIAFMLARSSEGPSVVVAPASVVANWQREISRFAPSLRSFLLSGQSSDARGTVLDALKAGDVLLLTYGLLASESERLSAVKWNVACLDEAHTIKNRDTKTSAAAMKLEASHRLILTGTPVQNHLGELWNLFRFINPGLLGTYEQFSEKYMSGGAASTMELKRLVAPFLLRRTKQEVVRELPDKEEIVVPVALTDDEAAVYEVIRREAVSQVSVGSAVSVNALSMITKLRMAACSASLAEKNWVGGHCSKLDALLDKLLPIVEGGNSVLVFSQFTSFLSMAAAALSDAGIKDFLYLDGQTPVARRQALVDSFQKGEHKVFLISLKAGGLGLNLTGANYVIHLDPWWNPAIEQQATDRAYRIGQSQKVTVYHLISSHTIEEKILRLHATKRSLADALLEGSDASSRITAEELLEMLG